jgi:hypothetical protein
MNIKYLCCPDPNKKPRSCEAINALKSLIRNNQFKITYTVLMEKSSFGNCHEVAIALMADLIMAGISKNWYWVEGFALKSNGEKWEHSWLEYDGWAIDASNHHTEPYRDEDNIPILVYDSDFYRNSLNLKVTRRRDHIQAMKFVFGYGS